MASLIGVAALVIKVTVVLCLGLALLRATSRRSGAIRHAIAAITLGAAALVPLATLVVPPLGLLPTPVSLSTAAAVGESGLAVDVPDSPSVQADDRPSLHVRWMITAVYACGTVLGAWPVVSALTRSRRLRREARLWRHHIAVVRAPLSRRPRCVPLLIHDAVCSPVACGAKSPAIIFPSSAPAWDPIDVDRAMAHELAHLRRADQVTHMAARLICAVFWFHPLVWLCWRTLRLEAERAADDAVVSEFEATAYATQLIRIARDHGASLAERGLLTMAQPGELSLRVRAVLDADRCRQPLRQAESRRMATIGVAVAATVGSLGATAAPPVAAPAPGVPVFQSATIRRSTADEAMALRPRPAGSLTITAAPLRTLIRLAYGVQEHAIVDGPTWLATSRFTIEATAPRHATADQTVDMLRALLAERFGLVVAAETRVQRVYAMQLTSSAPSRSPARPCNPKMPMDDVVIDGVADDTPPCGFVIARGRIDARGVDATALADTLGSFLGAQVVTDPSPNRFDLRLRWTDGHALEDVLRSQAGIVLEREARAVPVLAVRAVVAPPQ